MRDKESTSTEMNNGRRGETNMINGSKCEKAYT